jgi:hypothetical protein
MQRLRIWRALGFRTPSISRPRLKIGASIKTERLLAICCITTFPAKPTAAFAAPDAHPVSTRAAARSRSAARRLVSVVRVARINQRCRRQLGRPYHLVFVALDLAHDHFLAWIAAVSGEVDVAPKGLKIGLVSASRTFSWSRDCARSKASFQTRMAALALDVW